MCPEDDCHLTVEYHDHYVIRPTIRINPFESDYLENKINEKGTPVPAGFSYVSSDNDEFLTVEQLVDLNKEVMGT